MSVVCTLLGFGLRQTVDLGDNTQGRIVGAVTGHFIDHAQTLPRALLRAHDRSWQALGYALAGNSLLGRFKGLFVARDDKGFREEVRLFLNERSLATGNTPDDLRRDC